MVSWITSLPERQLAAQLKSKPVSSLVGALNTAFFSKFTRFEKVNSVFLVELKINFPLRGRRKRLVLNSTPLGCNQPRCREQKASLPSTYEVYAVSLRMSISLTLFSDDGMSSSSQLNKSQMTALQDLKTPLCTFRSCQGQSFDLAKRMSWRSQQRAATQSRNLSCSCLC